MMLYYLCGMILFFISMMLFILSIIMLMFNFSFFLEWMILNINSSEINMYIYLDWMCLMFIFTVFIISSMIMFYCVEYMSHDLNKIRFFYILFFFIMSMLMMILSPNMISILIGWDGLGLTSYCLVIFYQSMNSYNSGMLTVLLNRIGDIMIIMCLSYMFIYGSWKFLNYNMMNYMIMFFVVVASFTKSAQFPFSSWLPAAMAAPTPVSSLVHSSTLVTAGVYLMIRFNKLIYLNSLLMNYVMVTGLITMLMSGFCANFEFDMKKIIAFSTLSQLGLMMMIYSMKNYELAFFHLIIHAMFKSMMFMCSGILIHGMLNYQDIRFMGKIKEFFPMTSMMLMISNFSLCGMPFMSGFFSKDMILEMMFMKNMSLFIYFLLLLSTGLTVMYSVRMIYYLMNKEYLFFSLNNMGDFKMMNFPMLLLMIFSVFLGFFLNWMLFYNIENIFLMKFEKILILLISMIFMILGKYMYMIKVLLNYMYIIKFFFGKMWFMYNFNILMIKDSLKWGGSYEIDSELSWGNYYSKEWILGGLKEMKVLNNMNNNYMIMMMLLLSYLILLIFIFL
nr:NADH dehydrogenase subunit 5 [Hyssopus sp. 1 HHL-2023a]